MQVKQLYKIENKKINNKIVNINEKTNEIIQKIQKNVYGTCKYELWEKNSKLCL